MSLHFQIDIAFDLSNNVSDDLVKGLTALCENKSLTDEQKKLIPNIFKHISVSEKTNAFHGLSILYFEKHYRYTKDGADILRWTLHLRQVFNDDLFYEEGYPLIAWFATISETKGFVGYIKEELGQTPKLIYFESLTVNLRDGVKDDIKFKLDDFGSEVTKWKA